MKLLLKKIFSLVPSSNIILFESYPDFADNTYPVYLELRKRLPDYNMIWLIHETGEKKNNLPTVIKKKTIIEKVMLFYYTGRARVIISCNFILPKIKHGQLALFLNHGSPLKDVKGRYSFHIHALDYINLQSQNFAEYTITSQKASPEQLVYLGYPRCDWFYRPSRRKDIDSIVKGKYLVWLPTFRGFRGIPRDDAPGSVFNKIGVPLFYTVDALKDFDSFLRSKDIHILYKPHFVQDMSVVRKIQLENFIMISEKDFLGRDIQLYELLAQSEALITDYSSVFWDYLLLDKPIAITADDIESYKAGLGLICDFETISSEAAEVIITPEGMRNFISGLTEGKDTKREGRRKWRDFSNTYQDGKASERVADFVMEKIGETQNLA